VYKALDKRDGQIVAIKVLEIENQDTTNLRREIAILERCHSKVSAQRGSGGRDDGSRGELTAARRAVHRGLPGQL
jgi:hypothetical protein